MAIEKEKPDLYTVLKRRNRTVSDFLVETKIKDLEGLQTLTRSLENVYIISNQFVREANAHVLSKLSEKKVAEAKAVEVEQKAQEKDIENTNDEVKNKTKDVTETVPEEKTKPKRKTRTRKTTGRVRTSKTSTKRSKSGSSADKEAEDDQKKTKDVE